MTYTASPWQWDNGTLKPVRPSANLATIIDDDGCRVHRDANIDAWQAEQKANLRLIRAAPELLEALEEALEFIEDQEDAVDGDYGSQRPNRAMQLARELRSVIASAGGEPHG